jgi:hypothetical protein
MPDSAVEGVFRTGSSRELLTEAGEDVDLLVTGSRGYGPVGAVKADTPYPTPLT